MQRSICYTFLFFIVMPSLFLGGCAAKPKFHEVYLKGSSPGQPAQKISLDAEVSDRITSQWKAEGFFKKLSGAAIRPEIHWFDEENIILTIGDYGSYVISPETESSFFLEGAEQEAVLKDITDRVDVHSSRTTAGAILNGLRGALGGSTSYPYTGKVKEFAATLEVDMVIKFKRSKYSNTVTYEGSIENPETGDRIPFELYGNIFTSEYETDKVATDLLTKMKLSPDGNLLLYSTYLYDMREGKKAKPEPLIRNYGYVDATVDPSWHKIALLKAAKEAGEVTYWLELYALNIVPN